MAVALVGGTFTPAGQREGRSGCAWKSKKCDLPNFEALKNEKAQVRRSKGTASEKKRRLYGSKWSE
jgi:hypothetical protein